MIEKTAGVMRQFKEKIHIANGGRYSLIFHCIMQLEVFCFKYLKMGRIMEAAI